MKPELFRPGTCDFNVARSVIELDEYKLNELDLNGKVCLDIGGHIGSFAYACIQRGAKRVVSFEPDPDNYCLFRQHLSQEIQDGKVEVYPYAIGGHVLNPTFIATHSGHTSKDGEVNTGGGFIHGQGMEDEVLKEYQTGMKQKVVSFYILSAIKAFVEEIPFLTKTDCEGSEAGFFDIMEVSPEKAFGEVILGEYHGHGDFNGDKLKFYLNRLKYENVTLQPHGDSPLGLFWAK